MPEERTDSTEESAVEESTPAETAAPTMSASEKTFVRLTFWQTVLGVVGLFVAILALYAALTESAAVRHQTAAAVWPFVQFTIDDYDGDEGAMFRMSFTNAGVGPARMRQVRLVINDEAVPDWQTAVEQIGGDDSARVGRSAITDRVISPDESIVMISTDDPDLARKFQAAVANPANTIAYCYCSIFDECWLADSAKDIQNPESVEVCPDFGVGAYRN